MAKPGSNSIVEDNTRSNEQVVIAIRASAGGLEALQDFFSAMPPDTNLTFVVIQHQSPDYKSLMDELLARHTTIPIQVAGDGMPIRPNNIYLTPPRKNISIFHEKLYLDDQGGYEGAKPTHRHFFRSLATDKGKPSRLSLSRRSNILAA
ncbi:MAG: chemotaxis protein CheB [Tenuifilaceae bacterium]|nr:chemotaxis protein CheB [Tenuifilaceae bacterium]